MSTWGKGHFISLVSHEIEKHVQGKLWVHDKEDEARGICCKGKHHGVSYNGKDGNMVQDFVGLEDRP